jgi:hypothetical protein
MFFIPQADHAGVGGGHDINATRPKTANKVPIHGVLVNV